MTLKRRKVPSHDRPVFIISFPHEKAKEMIQTQIRPDKHESQCLSHIPPRQNHSCPVLLQTGRINPDISLFWVSTETWLVHFHLPLLMCCGCQGPPAEMRISLSQQCLRQVGSWYQHPGPGWFLSEPSAWGECLWFIHQRLLWSSCAGGPHHITSVSAALLQLHPG